jgi:hypothetical protein
LEQNRFDKNIDLHESEWSKADKKEPFFGPGAYWFFNVTLPTLGIALIVGAVTKFIVYGLFG